MSSSTTLFLALLFKPFIAFIVFGCIALPISLALSYLIPNGRIKNALYDRRLQQRRPVVFWVAWFIIVGALVAEVVFYI